MSYPSKRFEFAAAQPADGPEILRILESQPFPGRVSLLFTRRDDAYRSFMQEGQEVELLVCRDRQTEQITGFGAFAVHDLYVDGVSRRVGYLFGLRANGSYLRRFPLLHQSYEYLDQRCRQKQVDCFITTILSENQAVRNLLEKKRAYMPAYQFLEDYEVFALKASNKPIRSQPWLFRRAGPHDLGRIVDFLNQEGQGYQLFPVLKPEDILEKKFMGLSAENFYILSDPSGGILTAGAVWDQRSHKQYIVQGYSGWLRWLSQFSSWFQDESQPLFPKIGAMLNFFTLSFWAVKGNNESFFTYFLNSLSQETSQYPFFIVGLTKNHPLRALVNKRKYLSYQSRLYLVNWNKGLNLEPWDKNRGIYLECGWL